MSEKLEMLKAIAKDLKLMSVDYLDKHQKTGARGDKLKWIDLEFCNGQKVRLDKSEFLDPQFLKLSFNLSTGERFNN